MAKRLSDSEKWDDPWFCNLKGSEKLLWVYILDKCNFAGIFKVNPPLIQFLVGMDWNSQEFNGRLVPISEEKYFIPKFIFFQYGKFNEKNDAHKGVIKVLRAEGLDEFAETWANGSLSPPKPARGPLSHPKPAYRGPEPHKDKAKAMALAKDKAKAKDSLV